MSHFDFSARRLILAGGFALAVAAAPAFAAFALPSSTPSFGAACPGGEEEDLYTDQCVPHTVPNSPDAAFITNPANSDIPAVDRGPCVSLDDGACVGLAQDQPQFVPPESTIGSSPTITGSTS